MKNVFSKPDRIKGQGHHLFAVNRDHKPVTSITKKNYKNTSWHLTEVPNNVVICVTEKYKICY